MTEIPIEIPQLGFESKTIIPALEEDLNVEFGQSRKIRPEYQEWLQQNLSQTANRINEHFGTKQGLITPEKQEWLGGLAQSAVYLTPQNFSQLYKRMYQIANKGNIGAELSAEEGAAVYQRSQAAFACRWRPTTNLSEQLIFFQLTPAHQRVLEKRDPFAIHSYHEMQGTEELIHALDSLAPNLRGVGGDEWAPQRKQIAEAAARSYTCEMVNPFTQGAYKKAHTVAVEGWKKMAEAFGEDGEERLKRMFFLGEGIDEQTSRLLIQKAKEIWSDWSTGQEGGRKR